MANASESKSAASPAASIQSGSDEYKPLDFHTFGRAYNTALAGANVNVQIAMRLAGPEVSSLCDRAPPILRASSLFRCLEAFTTTTARLRDPADGVVAKTGHVELDSVLPDGAEVRIPASTSDEAPLADVRALEAGSVNSPCKRSCPTARKYRRCYC
jgi:hypothetical protein